VLDAESQRAATDRAAASGDFRMRTLSAASTLASLACLAGTLHASDGVRVACWNITNYGGGNTANIENVVYGEFNGNRFAPDVILLQEIETSGALAQIVSTLNTGLGGVSGSPPDWTAAQFFSGGGGGINTALVYRSGMFDLVGSTLVAPNGGTSANPRNIVRYDLRLEGYLAEETVIALYPVHMKAGSSGSDQARRLVEAQIIRDDAETLPAGRHIIVGGDFNIQSSSQAAYQELTGFQANNNGRVLDPINAPGSWNNSFTYRNIHTQDPVGGGGWTTGSTSCCSRAAWATGSGSTTSASSRPRGT
jgi:endonuclease/exonuclease/phosphatase family metal-dependent hydrolase